MARVGTVRELWRYPVKSMGGERLEAAQIDRQGVLGDRLWAVRDVEAGIVTSAKRLPALLQCRASYVRPPQREEIPHVRVRMPDGAELESRDPATNRALSELVGREVALCSVDQGLRHFLNERPSSAKLRQIFGVKPGEPLPDLSMFPLWKLLELALFATPPGTHFDAYPLHLLSTASLCWIAERAPGSSFEVTRFRPNLLVEDEAEGGLVENAWCGGTLAVGGARLPVRIPTVRCSMPARAQPDLRADPGVMKAIAAHAERCLGVYASVARGGRVRVGDALELEPASSVRRAAGATRKLKRLMLRASERLLPR